MKKILGLVALWGILGTILFFEVRWMYLDVYARSHSAWFAGIDTAGAFIGCYLGTWFAQKKFIPALKRALIEAVRKMPPPLH